MPPGRLSFYRQGASVPASSARLLEHAARPGKYRQPLTTILGTAGWSLLKIERGKFEKMLNSNPEEVQKATKNSINFCKELIEGETGYAYE